MTTVNLQHYPYPVSISVLDNQLTVITMTTPSDLARVRFIARVGSLQDGPNKGLAHLYEHLACLGPNREPMRPDFRQLRKKGVKSNAATGKFKMFFDGRGLREYTTKTITALARQVFGFATTEKALAEEKLVIEQEYKDSLQGINYHYWLFKQLYPAREDIYADVIGNRESLAAIKLENLHQFREDWLVPANLALIVMGNVAHKRVVETMTAPAIENRKGRVNPALPPLEPAYTRGVYECHDMSPEIQTYLPLPADEKEQSCLDLAANMLAGDLSSILMKVLRQKRAMVYSLGYDSDNYPFLYFPIGGGADPKSFDRIENTILAEIKKIGQGRLPRETFQTIKADRITSVRTRLHEYSGDDWLGILSDDWLFGRIYDDIDWPSFWKEIAPEQIIAAVNKYWSGEKHGRFDVFNP